MDIITTSKVTSAQAATSVRQAERTQAKLEQEQKRVSTGENQISASSAGMTSEQIKAEIEKLEAEKAVNIKKMDAIEEEIKKLAKEAEDNIIEATKKQEAAVADHEDEARDALNSNIAAYIEANKEGGDGMSKEQLAINIKNSMPDSPNIAKAMALMIEANEQIAEIDSLLGSLNLLILDTQQIENDISIKQADYDAALAAEEAAKKAAESKKCDPIGFMMGSGYNQVRYDFIVDDGKFDSTSDFLGSDNNWASMEALDVNGDKTVTAQELSDHNIKMVKTDAAGKKQVVDIAQEFGSNFSIDLNSYAKGNSHYAIDPGADADGNGVADQEVMGTFNVNVNGKEILGYNTLDDVNYLASEYGVSAGAQAAKSDAFGELSADLQPHGNFFNEYTEKSAELKAQLDEAMVNMGITEENIEGIKKQAQKDGGEKANIFMKQLEEKMEAEAKQEEIEEAAAAQEEAEQEEAAQAAVEEASVEAAQDDPQAVADRGDAGDDTPAEEEEKEIIEELEER